jgi:preprotein translocase SecE subunit
MENQRQKWVNLIFTGVAILVAAIAFIGLTRIAAVNNLESSIKQIDLIIRFGSIAFGALVGFGLYLNDKSNSFMNEVVLELVRVSWPTPDETMKATFLVICFVLIAGMVLGGFDSLWAWIMKLIL